MSGAEQHKYRVEEVNRALVRQLGRPCRVLDVGCGIGLNGAVAKRKGAHVTGIEIVPWAAERAREQLDEVLSVDITDGAAVTRALAGRSFDLMMFPDVLEHLAEPDQALGRLLDYLDDGGHVLVSLPNVAAWTNRLNLLRGRWDYRQSGILDDSHLRFFTLGGARRLCESVGLEVLHTEQNPMLVRAAREPIARLLVERQADPDPAAFSRSLPYKLYQGLVRPFEDVLANRFPELLAFQHVVVARKPTAKRKLSLTVGMLTMDEEESAARMIGEIKKLAPDAQILCVDSSTKDRTPQICRELGARVLRQVPPRGHGPAMELLMVSAAAQSELLIYLDCDFTYPPSYIPVLRKLVEEEGADV
ncbi:MAG: methyltransferase domain-containing protein, partial [Deltaproteobacteria bacterium]|nr:methyltransferase domain-containing protein [Deltaproteobacteria bacterium]